MSDVRIFPCFRTLGLLVFAGLIFGAVGGDLRGQVAGGSAEGSGTTAAATSNPVAVSGQVLNASNGLPVPRALVRMNSRAMLTDHEGKFEFDQVTDNSVNLTVMKPGFAPSMDPGESMNTNLRVDQISGPVVLRLYPDALLTGTVTAPDGSPLNRVPVSARRSVFDENGHRWMPVGQTQTDSHGNFRLPVPAGDYKLELRYWPRGANSSEAVLPLSVPGDSSSNTSDVIRVRAGEEQHFDLRPATSRTYVVTAISEAHEERVFPRITARSSNGTAIQINPIRSTRPGEIRVELPRGTYTLIATTMSPDNPEQAEATVTITDHDVSGVVLRFAPIPSLPVELLVDQDATSDKAPPNVAQLGLMLQADESDPDRGDATVRANNLRDRNYGFSAPPGSYRLMGRTGGGWYIKSVSYGASDLLQQELVVAPGAGGTPIRVTVSDVMGSLQGTVRLNGSPAECWIYLVPTTPSAEPLIMLRSGPDGSYNYSYMPPGSYRAIAFEHHHSLDYHDAATLATFATHLGSVTVAAGDKATLDLDAVSDAELTR